MGANHKPARPAAPAASFSKTRDFVVQTTCPTCQGTGTVITDPCDNCHGKGLKPKQTKLTINIPAGAEDVNRLRVRGEGEPSTEGGPRRHYVYLSVKPHEHLNAMA